MNHRISQKLDVHSYATMPIVYTYIYTHIYTREPAASTGKARSEKRDETRDADARLNGIEIFIGVACVASIQPIYISSHTRKDKLSRKRRYISGMDRSRGAPLERGGPLNRGPERTRTNRH